MSLRKVQLWLSVLALSFSPPSHAGEVFESQVLKIGEVCAWRTSIILNGQNICEVPSSTNESVEVSQDGGKTWKTLWLGGMLALDLTLWLGLLVRSRQKVSQDSGTDTKGREPQELPLLKVIIDESTSEKVELAKNNILDMFERVWIHGYTRDQFIHDKELNLQYLNFSHEYRFFQVGINKDWYLYFHWFNKRSETMNRLGEWKINTPDFWVTIWMMENFLDVLKMFTLQEEEGK